MKENYQTIVEGYCIECGTRFSVVYVATETYHCDHCGRMLVKGGGVSALDTYSVTSRVEKVTEK